MVNMLGFGVYWSGFVKDALCIPRPLSPPLRRITMSGSAALEYGFPSTHSTNAVSVAVYAIHRLGTIPASDRWPFHDAVVGLFYFYAVSIVVGRLYCGMHGFTDVICGSLLGAAIAMVQIRHGDDVYAWLCGGGYMHMLIVIVTMLVLVRVHPEPADDCPCFDDSVSFAGVQIGCMFGAWTYTGTRFAWEAPVPGSVPFELATIGYVKAALRIVLGVLIVFVWREVAKPFCLTNLPKLFRVLEKLDLSLPRKWELRASQYTVVPPLRRDDNVLPSASEIPSLVANFRNPRRRAVSVGPQSAADAYETLAYRQKRRRQSRESASPEPVGSRSPPPQSSPSPPAAHVESPSTLAVASGSEATDAEPSPTARLKGRIRSFELMMGQGEADVAVDEGREVVGVENEGRIEGTGSVPDEHEERALFLRLQKPRVRYDVEVVTKLIVYSGKSRPNPLNVHPRPATD
jgi:dihydrosphingosine 1-phosphate phosphatase